MNTWLEVTPPETRTGIQLSEGSQTKRPRLLGPFLQSSNTGNVNPLVRSWKVTPRAGRVVWGSDRAHGVSGVPDAPRDLRTVRHAFRENAPGEHGGLCSLPDTCLHRKFTQGCHSHISTSQRAVGRLETNSVSTSMNGVASMYNHEIGPQTNFAPI